MGWKHKGLVVAGLMAGGLLLAGMALDGEPAKRPVSDHFDGERFHMPAYALSRSAGEGAPTVGDKSPAELIRWLSTRQPAAWPEAVPVNPVRPPLRIEGETIRATMVGHATVLIQTAGLNILTDPIWSERASPVGWAGPRRVAAPGVRFAELPPVDLVLVSHGHYDHLDLPTLKRLWHRDRPLILVPAGHGELLAAEGIRARELDWGEAAALGPLTAVAEPVYHWTSRRFLDRNRALWAGFTLILPGGNIYFAGDSGYGDGSLFRAARRHGPVRLALLPVGAYEPRWFMAAQHMNPAEAVAAKADLGAAHALGLHWGTFQLTDESRDAPLAALAAARAEAGIAPTDFPALAPGEVMELPPPAPPTGT